MENLLFAKDYPLTILIADDSPGALARTRELLGQLGYQTDTAKSGKEVLNRMGQKEYDLVLLELHMRDSDRFGVIELLRARHKAHPLVIGTGPADDISEGLHIACLREGMDHFIGKPLVLNELALQLKACSILTGKRRIDVEKKVA